MASNEINFKQLVDSYHQSLYRYAYWLVGKPHIAEDLVQETFLRAWKNMSQLRDMNSAKAWLITILRRERARLYERKQLELVDDFILDELPSDLSNVELNPDILALRSQISKLAEHYKEPLILQVVEGYSLAEIADILSVPAKTVATRLHRARRQLRDSLSDSGSDGTKQGASV